MKKQPNQSLERTPDEQSCFASPVVCGRRSALRSAGIAGFGPTRVVREVRGAHAPQTTVAV
jgi:hypothetical protein